MHPGREANDDQPRAGLPKGRHRATEIAAMLAAHGIEERREARTAAAVGIVNGGRLRIWQNGGLAGKGTHGAPIVARDAGSLRRSLHTPLVPTIT